MSERDQDFEDARRGFIAALDPGRIEAPDGRVVWDSDAYDFLAGDCPETATPSLWRQSRLTAIQGLFEIAPRFFQVRGLDLSNMEKLFEAGRIEIEGDGAKVGELFGVMDEPDRRFAIVTP